MIILKKTKMTILTSAILSMSAASANLTSDSVNTKNIREICVVYGPPTAYSEINGDVNSDNKLDIIDVCLIKSAAQENNFIHNDTQAYDVNKDASVDSFDYRAVRNYFLGIIPDILDDRPAPITTTAPVYGPPSAFTVTTPPVTTPVYGPPSAFTTRPEEMQTKYERFPTTIDDEVD